MAQGMTLDEWLERKRMHDAEVTAGRKSGPFTIPRPKRIIGGPKIARFDKAGGKISSYYKKGGNVVTGR